MVVVYLIMTFGHQTLILQNSGFSERRRCNLMRMPVGGKARSRESDRLRERQGSRFENLKIFEFDTGLLGALPPALRDFLRHGAESQLVVSLEAQLYNENRWMKRNGALGG